MSETSKTASLPRTQVAINELGKLVHTNWQTLFPNLQVPLYNLRDLDSSNQQLSAALKAADDLDLERKSNSVALRKINEAINKACTQLKRYIQEEQPDRRFWESEYANFGLLKNEKGVYTLPTDNARRRLSIVRLLDKLSNSSFAARAYGLNHWQPLHAQHSQLWDKSDQYRSNRSRLSTDAEDAYKATKAILVHIHQYLSVAYPKSEVKRRRREMGFLKESF